MSSSQPHEERRSNKRGLFAESGLTEEERRRIRSKQRLLHEKIEGGPDDEEEVSKMEFLSKVRDENNEIFHNVRFTREAVLDAENAGLIVEKARLEVDKLRSVARFDAEKLARTLRSKLSDESTEGRQFNWALLGRECGICFSSAPSGVRFLAGSVDMEGEKVVRKARAKRQKEKADEAPEIRPELMDKEAAAGDADALSAAEKVMKDLEKLLKKRAKQEYEKQKEVVENSGDPVARNRLKEHAGEVDGVHFLMNPKSFTQSVENIFNVSFLVKKGRAAVGVRSKMEGDDICPAGLWVQPRSSSSDEDGLPESTQAVVSFTMKDWRRICQAHDLKKGDIPHRTGSRHERVAASSQSQRE
eukprot:scaffold2357_cov167-Amphora_coffeaeformis.AAC.29